jgi:hypothetical protein
MRGWFEGQSSNNIPKGNWRYNFKGSRKWSFCIQYYITLEYRYAMTPVMWQHRLVSKNIHIYILVTYCVKARLGPGIQDLHGMDFICISCSPFLPSHGPCLQREWSTDSEQHPANLPPMAPSLQMLFPRVSFPLRVPQLHLLNLSQYIVQCWSSWWSYYT